MAGAKEVVGCITTAVTNAAADMAVSKLVDNLSMQMPVAEKLQRLEILLIEIHSAVEATEKHIVKNTWLLQWRDKLKEAASAGDEVLASFKQRAMDVQQTTSNGAFASSSTSAANTGALSFTRNTLSGIVQGVRSASKIFSGNEDLKVLSNAVKNLEQLSPGKFTRLLQIEISPKAEQRPTEKVDKRNAKKKSFKRRVSTGSGSRRAEQTTSPLDYHIITVVTLDERRGKLIVSQLKKTLAEISEFIHEANCRNLRDLQWPVSWAETLRDDTLQGLENILYACVSGEAGIMKYDPNLPHFGHLGGVRCGALLRYRLYLLEELFP